MIERLRGRGNTDLDRNSETVFSASCQRLRDSEEFRHLTKVSEEARGGAASGARGSGLFRLPGAGRASLGARGRPEPQAAAGPGRRPPPLSSFICLVFRPPTGPIRKVSLENHVPLLSLFPLASEMRSPHSGRSSRVSSFALFSTSIGPQKRLSMFLPGTCVLFSWSQGLSLSLGLHFHPI